jgi:glycosyltransferase involved in cell wall biosynthesis
MKIAYLIDTITCDTAGTQKQLLETIRRLNRAEFEPRLICLWESPWMTNHPLPCHCTVLGYRGLLKVGFPRVVRQLANLISRDRIDIVQTFFEDSIFVAWLSALLARPRPVLLSSRRDIGLGSHNQPWYHALFGLALPIVNRHFNGIIANSEEVRTYVAMRERTPPGKIKVHYNGVTLPAAGPASAPGSLATHDADVWIGLVASLTVVKRHDLLIRAFARLISGGLPGTIRLVLLGEGPQRDHLEQLAQSSGVRDLVHFEGEVSDVSSYLRRLDIGVLCSDREGLSNAILEYMAFSLPVVATRVGGNPELVTQENGILVEPGDADALAQALQLLVADQHMRARMGVASRERAARLFSWDRSMADLEGYYRSLLRPAEPSSTVR